MKLKFQYGVFVLCLLTACAKVEGSDEALDASTGPIGAGNGSDTGGANAGSGSSGAATGGSSSGGSTGATSGGSTSSGNTGASTGGSTSAGSTGSSNGATTGSPPPPPPPPPPTGPGSCDEPFPLTFMNNKATASGTTSGGSGVALPSSCANVGLFTPVQGPEHVYAFEMPFKGKVAIDMNNPPTGFKASVYLLSTCGAPGTSKACDFLGALSYDAAAGEKLFLNVDSGSGLDPLVMMMGPTQGPYTLNVTLRKEAGEGEPCDPTGSGDYCLADLLCRKEANANVCRKIACGDGYVEGNEECDDNKSSGSPCSQCKFTTRESCASPAQLEFRAEGTNEVARAKGNTSGALDDFDAPGCDGNTLDQVYSFTLTAERRITVKLDPAGGFDASFALTIDACSTAAVSQVTCQDQETDGDAESYTATVPAGTYYVVVDGPRTLERGEYDLTITAAAP